MKRIALWLAALLIVSAPLGEGGRRPDVLALLHAAAIALMTLAAMQAGAATSGRRLGGRGAGLLALPCAAFALASLSGARASYLYAAGLGLLDWLVAVGCLLGAALFLASPDDLGWLRRLTVAMTTLHATLAIAGWFRGGPMTAAGSFLNPNHLAAYLNIGAILCATALTGEMARGVGRRAALWAGLGLLHFSAVVLLQSRGAYLGLAAAGTVLLAACWRGWSFTARRAAVAAVILFALAGAWLLHLRFAGGEDQDRFTRLRIWSAGARMVMTHPVLGLGPGSFPHEAARFNFPGLSGPIRFGRSFSGAHSVWLTEAAEDGVPSALLVLVFGAGAAVLLCRRHGEGAAGDAALGTGIALAALLVQSLVEDFQQRPALVLTTALLAGSALSFSRGWSHPAREGGRVIFRRAAVLLLSAYLVAAGVILPAVAWSEARQARVLGRTGVASMRRAARLDPWNAEYHHDLAMAALNSGPPSADRYSEAAGQLLEAQRLNPGDARFPFLLARLEARAGQALFDDTGTSARAARLYAAAVALAPTDPRPRLEQAGHLASLGRLEEAVATLETGLALEPNYRRAQILKASLLLKLGREDEARRAFDRLADIDRALAGYQPDSAYANEIAADAPSEREAVLASLNTSQGVTGDGLNRAK